MRLLSTLISLAVLAAAPASAQMPEWRLDPTVSPIAQGVELRLDPASDRYEGSTTVSLRVTAPVSSFRLHAEGMEIRSLRLLRGSSEIPVTHEAGERAILHVRSERPLEPGEYLLAIEFANEYDRRAVGLYKMLNGSEPYLFTQFQATDGRKAFPMWDEPGYKIPFNLTFIIPKQMDAVTNTPIESVEERGEWKVLRFQQTKPLPSYLLAIAVGKFEFTPMEGLGVPGRIVTVPGRRELTGLAIAETPRVLAALEEYFGMKYPYEKLDFIAVPEYWPGAMEHPGAVTYAENVLLLDPARATLGQRRFQGKIIAHELAHMWFGDLVTMQWWDDLWLSESFADWLGDKITDQLHPDWQVHISEMQSRQNVMTSDARPSAEPIRRAEVDNPESVLNSVGLAYNKGKSVLSMFEQWIGPESFRKGVIRYLEKNAWKNAEASDLWETLSDTGKKELPAALESFLFQPGMPIIDVEIAGPGEVRLSQRRFLPEGTKAPPLLWKVPVSVRYSAGGKIAEMRLLLDSPERVFRLTEGELDWVYPHADAVGYYRWSLPSDAMDELGAAASERLDTVERIAFLGNLTALLDGGELRGDEFVRLVGRFAGDADPLVLAALVPMIGKVELAFVTPELEPAYAEWVRSTLRPALERIGSAAKPGESEAVATVRAQILEMLAEAGDDPEALATGSRLARAYMEEPASVHPALATTVLQIAAVNGDHALFEEYRLRFETANSPTERSRYLTALASFRDPKLSQQALEYALEGPLRPNEIVTLASQTAEGVEGRDRLYAWATENWDEIVGRVPPFMVEYMPFIAGGCEESRMVRARRFFGEPEHGTEGTPRQLQKVADQVSDCVRLRAREGARVAEYLRDRP